MKSFKELVDQAYAGRLKLPAFQRKWRWPTQKVMRLFDSLRQKYPIGSLLFLGGEGKELSPRPFHASNPKAEKVITENLVLDGQQRITAGVCLFYGAGTRLYFLNLETLAKQAAEAGVNLKDPDSARAFAASLDIEDSYLTCRPTKGDPRSLLISNHLLCTTILADSVGLNAAMLDYSRKYPEREDLMFRLVQPHFNMSAIDNVPYVTIDASTQIEAISRIFTTLNTTGQMLSPFELVVAILYPKDIDLVKDYEDMKKAGTFFPAMDSTGEILLQTIAMLEGVDPKKSNLPKNITAELYQKHKETAFFALEDLGDYLTNSLGAGLDVLGASLVPYDAIYAPMACAYRVYRQQKLKGVDEANAKRKFAKWYVGSALDQRYQEGVHNKQRKDYSEFLLWLNQDSLEPQWFKETTTRLLRRASIEGAIGKLIQGLINLRSPTDPVTGNKIGYRFGSIETEKHHVFPTKYLKNIPLWNSKQDTGDTILNMMYLERDTNKRWINNNPSDHIEEALQATTVAGLVDRYKAQFISSEAFDILRKAKKTKKDFEEFLELRQSTIRDYIKQEFGFEPANIAADEDLDEES